MSASGAATTTSSKDLLIVGPGVLGRLVAAQWREAHPTARIVGETSTKDNHDALRALGIEPRDREEGMADEGTFPFVLFAAPPSGSDDYPGELARAGDRWSGEGTFLFTGSAAVYDVEEGACDEDSPLKTLGMSDRSDRLLASEDVVLSRGGCVVRLVGLYHAHRGAHHHFLKIQTVPRWGDKIINLIHYEDAADISCAILKGTTNDDGSSSYFRSKAFLGADGHPVSFQALTDATLSSDKYRGACKFVGEPDGPEGKRVSNQKTRDALGGWKPKHASFESFMASGAVDSYADHTSE